MRILCSALVMSPNDSLVAGLGAHLHPRCIVDHVCSVFPCVSIVLPSPFPQTPCPQPAFLERVAALSPDLAVTAAYGNMLPQTFLDLPRLGTLNVHPSLLPKYRGAAPVQRAVEVRLAVGSVALKQDAGRTCRAADSHASRRVFGTTPNAREPRIWQRHLPGAVSWCSAVSEPGNPRHAVQYSPAAGPLVPPPCPAGWSGGDGRERGVHGAGVRRGARAGAAAGTGGARRVLRFGRRRGWVMAGHKRLSQCRGLVIGILVARG